jgi:hypothetical protein
LQIFPGTNKTGKRKYMKKLLTLTSVLRVAALTSVIACVGAATTSIAAPPQREVMLQQAGFKTHAVTTAGQKQHLQALPAGKVSIVQQNGRTFYAYPDAAHNLIYTGNEAQYQAYKQVQLEASRQNRGLNIDPDPHGIRINEFNEFGPLGGDER